MRQRYRRPFQYRFTNPPKAIRNATFDNIAIVPASMLPLKGTIQDLLNTLPKGGVVLCHATENAKQQRVLARVEAVFKQHGHEVTNVPMEQIL